jgi:hypothetical protein
MLNLVVKVLFEATTVMPLLNKCRKLVGSFKHSTTLSEQLANTIRTLQSNSKTLCLDDEDIDLEVDLGENFANNTLNTTAKTLCLDEEDIDELNIHETYFNQSRRTKLVQDLVTRWNSTLAMLTSINESHAAIRMVITSDPERKKNHLHQLLTDAELVILEDLIDLLDPFLEMTKLVSGSKYVTISIVLPSVTRLLECLKLYEPSKRLVGFF